MGRLVMPRVPERFSDIMAKTEEVTIVLEPLADGKIRCTGRPWDDGVTLLKDQVPEVRAVGKQV
jgi:hypothetical protein